MFFMILRLTIKEYCNIEHFFYLGDHDHELPSNFSFDKAAQIQTIPMQYLERKVSDHCSHSFDSKSLTY